MSPTTTSNAPALSATLTKGIDAKRRHDADVKAGKLGCYFKRGARAISGDAYTFLSDDRPEWLQDAVYEAHQGSLPNDWVYAECEAACYAIDDGSIVDEDGEPDNDGISEHADGRVDICNPARYAFAADLGNSDLFANAEKTSADLCAKDASILDRLGCIQYAAIELIAYTMARAFKANKDETPEEPETDEDNASHDVEACPCDVCHEEKQERAREASKPTA